MAKSFEEILNELLESISDFVMKAIAKAFVEWLSEQSEETEKTVLNGMAQATQARRAEKNVA